MACIKPSVPWHSIKLYNLEGDSIFIGNEFKNGTILYFLSPECPLCENYSLNINEIANSSHKENFKMYGIFPGLYYSEAQIEAFKIKYELTIPFLLDPDYDLTHALNATVTPEVFVFNSEGNQVYQGAIDNWMVSLGKKRTVVTEHYLLDVISALNNNSLPKIKKTKPIGCYIE